MLYYGDVRSWQHREVKRQGCRLIDKKIRLCLFDIGRDTFSDILTRLAGDLTEEEMAAMLIVDEWTNAIIESLESASGTLTKEEIVRMLDRQRLKRLFSQG